jgi:hypothetical protein
MGKEIKVVIPSHLRHDRVTTTKAIDNCIICVAESQVGLYKDYNRRNEIVAHPDDLIGIAPKRQWIYEKFGNVFMVDDDITQMARVYTEKGEKTRVQKRVAYDLIQQLGNMALDMGIYLYSFSKNPMPTAYNPLKPFNLTGTIMGGGFGLNEGSKIHFNSNLNLNEDYFVSGLNAHYHRMCLIDNRFTFKFRNTFENKGGLAAYRTVTKELDDTLTLKKYFGDSIQLKKDTHLAKVKVEGSRTLRIPF